jgi:hypothetical protein
MLRTDGPGFGVVWIAIAATNHVFDLRQLTMIPSPNSLSVSRRGRAFNRLSDGVSSTIGLLGLPCMRADGTASRSFQYCHAGTSTADSTAAIPDQI